MPDGRIGRFEVPEGTTPENAQKMIEHHLSGNSDTNINQQAEPQGVMQGLKRANRAAGEFIRDAGAGALRGAGSIGATLLSPLDIAKDAIAGKGLSLESNRQRRAAMDSGLREMGADTESLAYGAGKLGGEIAGTAGIGGVLAGGVRAVSQAPRAAALANALASSGMKAGTAPGVGNMLTRMAGGGVAGGAMAGMVNPEDAGSGAAIGSALPPALKAAGIAAQQIGKAGSAVVNPLRGGSVSPEVAALANRAKSMGIDIPADRLTSSKPLDAIASGLNYIPFSGRAATEARMNKQLTQAASRLIGQDSDNMALALRKASDDLGGKFDDVLKNNPVKFDAQLYDDLTTIFATAEKELGSDALKPVAAQMEELFNKGASGVIDGQAAYNIKRTLDRLGRGNTPTAHHATEMKKALMGALDRSLGADQAAAFAKTRQQYGNMLALEKIAKNGVEGEISIARLANIRNINNKPLQEIADIAAQFVKPREGQHGAMQRAAAALGVGSLTGLPGLAATAAGGRGVNAVLNSNGMRDFVMRAPQQNSALGGLLSDPDLLQFGYRAAPLLGVE